MPTDDGARADPTTFLDARSHPLRPRATSAPIGDASRTLAPVPVGATLPLRMASPHRPIAPLLAVWLLQLAAFFTPSATWSPMSRFALTHAVASGRGLTLGAWAASTGDRARVGDAWYSDKAPLPALLGVVPYTLVHTVHGVFGRAEPAFEAEARGDVPAVHVTLNTSAQQLLYATAVGVSGVGFVVLALHLYAMLRRRHDRRTALVATTLVCLGTPLLPYATSLYGHAPAAAFLVVALASLDPAGPPPRLELAGLCLACAAGCEYLSVVPGAVIGLYAIAVGGRAGALVRLRRVALGALPAIVLVGAYHQACFGAPWSTGYAHLANPTFVAGHAHGLLGIGLPSPSALAGLLLSPRRGLFYLAPITAIASVGLFLPAPALAPTDAPTAPRWLGRDPIVAVGALALVALYLANAGYYMWWGGASAGPRHLVPAIPVLAFGLARVWQRPRARPLVVALGVVSTAIMLGFTAVGIEAPEGGDAIFDFLLPRLRAGEISSLPSATNLGLLLGLPPLSSVVPWIAWLVVIGRVLWRRTDETKWAS